MHSYLNRVAALVVATSLLACGRGGDSGATADTTARDLTLPGADSMVQPQLQDVPLTTPDPGPAAAAPATQPPRATAPAPKAAPPKAPAAEPEAAAPAPRAAAPTTGVIAAGTSLALVSSTKVCTNTNKVGDRFNATLTAAITGTNGVTLPEGTTVSIELTELKRSENKDQQIIMGFRVVSLTAGGETYTPDAEVVSAEIDRVRAQSSGEAAKKVVGGAAAGAIVGQILGRDRKGTLIGAAVGAAAGAAAAAASDDHDGCVDVGAPMTVRLNGPLSLPVK